MKIQTTISALAIMMLFPLAASAQGFNNININLNDVMVGQRNQDMARMLDQVNSSAVFAVKKHSKKHDKQNRDHKMASLKQEDAASNTESSIGTVSAAGSVSTGANQESNSATTHQ